MNNPTPDTQDLIEQRSLEYGDDPSIAPVSDKPPVNHVEPARLTESESVERHVLGRALVPLMKGVVYKDADSRAWETLLNLQPRVQDHVAVLGLELMLHEAEGYAFLRTRDVEADDDDALPRLMTRRALSFPVSLLIALLRKRLVEFDVAGGETRLVLTRNEIVDLLRLFLPDTSNEARLIDQVDTHIRKVLDLGFLRKMKAGSSADKEERFEVKRIIRAFVDAQWLSEFDERLVEYAAQLRGDTMEAGDDQNPTASS